MSALLQLERYLLEEEFGHAPFLVSHRLSGHALFELPQLMKLARALPERQVEYNAGDVPISLDPAATPRTGLGAEETIRRIAECRSWLVLKNVERDPQYAELLERCLAEVRPHVPGMSQQQGFIFVSSPGAVTPYHMDPEENFLLQVRGGKTLRVFDRAVLSERELERFFSGAHRNLAYRDEYRSRARAFRLSPGLGVHVPVTAPHWVQNGPEVSVSFSITFQTPASTRMAHAHRMNARLRRLGLRPAPVGGSPLRDALKQLAFRMLRRAGARLQAQ
jgi:hypothetical protein